MFSVIHFQWIGFLNDNEAVEEGSLDLLTCTEDGVVLNDASEEEDDDEEGGKVVESDTDHEGKWHLHSWL